MNCNLIAKTTIFVGIELTMNENNYCYFCTFADEILYNKTKILKNSIKFVVLSKQTLIMYKKS